jgi:hypothetical protein
MVGPLPITLLCLSHSYHLTYPKIVVFINTTMKTFLLVFHKYCYMCEVPLAQ